MTTSPLLPYFAKHYAEVKRHYPTEGRRRWRLRVAQRFWTAVTSGTSTEDLLHHLGHVITGMSAAAHTGECNTDPDPLDGVSRDIPELGLLVRTDFSNQHAWETFCARLQDCERKAEPEGGDADEDASEQGPPFDNMDEEDDSDLDEDAENAPIFRIVNPSSHGERAFLTDASNLTVLRLFNDVDVRRSPPLLQNAKHIYPPNRLVDHHGWQEIYQGKNIWIYDVRSNVDQCVRVVSQSGDMYGTATGDSWRARVSHICELQASLSMGLLKIDFGGLDRWDFNERKRNMTEAEGE